MLVLALLLSIKPKRPVFIKVFFWSNVFNQIGGNDSGGGDNLLDTKEVKNYNCNTEYYKRRTVLRTTKVLSFSLPPDTAKRINELSRKKKQTKSELLREMVEVYEKEQAEESWRELFSFGKETVTRAGIKNEEELFELLSHK